METSMCEGSICFSLAICGNNRIAYICLYILGSIVAGEDMTERWKILINCKISVCF